MDKVVIFLFLLGTCSNIYAAQPDSTQYAGQKNPWLEILDLEYDNAETIETATTNYLVTGTESRLYIFAPDGTVRYFTFYIANGEQKKRKIKEEQLSQKQQEQIKQLLRRCRETNFSHINPKLLNITVKDNVDLIVSRGETFRFRYIGLDYYKDFATYAPLRYIERKFPGWQDRAAMLNLIIDFTQIADPDAKYD